jgi:predicted glycosyltransferase
MGPPVGWQMESINYWRHNYREFVEFFFDQLLPEPHSTKQWEDAVGWALEGDLESMIAHEEAPFCVSDRAGAEAMLARVRCPVLAVHGSADQCQPQHRSERFAELTGGRFVGLEGAGHLPQAREPVLVNHLFRDFVDLATEQPPAAIRWTRPLNRPRKVLMVSSPIGLGHTRRDLAIAQELHTLRPDVQVDWLAQAPVSDVVAANGETVHPASQFLASEVEHMESESAEHDLHAFQAIRAMDEILVTNFMVFDELVRSEHYDAWVADEGWDVDYFLHENPELKSSAYVWMTDFVGWLPMPDGGDRERLLASDYNAEMVEQVARFPRLRDRSLFVGDPVDCVPDGLGDGLPSVRGWTESHFEFTGYITGYQPLTDDERLEVRAELGWRPDEQVVVVAVGGTSVGAPLLRRTIAAYPAAARAVPGLRMEVVAGPRIDPASLTAPDGVRVHGYVPDLYRVLAASDLAVVQGGLTTCMELVANRRPFLYVPLRHHFEQTFHVPHRLARYGAGRRLDYDDTVPEPLAAAIASEVGRAVDYRPVETDGAARAARRIAELV